MSYDHAYSAPASVFIVCMLLYVVIMEAEVLRPDLELLQGNSCNGPQLVLFGLKTEGNAVAHAVYGA